MPANKPASTIPAPSKSELSAVMRFLASRPRPRSLGNRRAARKNKPAVIA